MDAVRRDFVANVSHELKTPVGALSLLAEAVHRGSRRPGRRPPVRRPDAAREPSGWPAWSRSSSTSPDCRVPSPLPEPAGRAGRDVRAGGRRPRAAWPPSARQIDVVVGDTAGLRVCGRRRAARHRAAPTCSTTPSPTRPTARGSPSARAASATPSRSSVTDQGIGIAAGRHGADLRALLPGRPGALPRDRRHGLGLAIVKHIAGNHGGHGDRLEREGAGSTFTCTCRRSVERRASEGVGRGMTRVLVVEDEESFSDALSYMLRREGFEVGDRRPPGRTRSSEFDRSGADLVLLDLMLPGLSGTEVCRQLRQRSNVPVIMLTARDSEIDKVVGLELGADDYVTKPFSSRELVARIRAVLRRNGEPRGAAARRRRGGTGPHGRRPAHRDRQRRRDARCRSRSSSCWRCCCATPAGC